VRTLLGNLSRGKPYRQKPQCQTESYSFTSYVTERQGSTLVTNSLRQASLVDIETNRKDLL
jgi:hypothetical protein